MSTTDTRTPPLAPPIDHRSTTRVDPDCAGPYIISRTRQHRRDICPSDAALAPCAHLVLAVDLEVLADRDGLLDEVPEVLGDTRRKTVALEDTQDLVTRQEANLKR